MLVDLCSFGGSSLTSPLQTPCSSRWLAWPFTPVTSSCRSTSWLFCTTSRLSSDTKTPPIHPQVLSVSGFLSIHPPASRPVCPLPPGLQVGVVSNHAETELFSSFSFLKLIKYLRSKLWRSRSGACWTSLFPGLFLLHSHIWDCEQCWALRQGLRRARAWFCFLCLIKRASLFWKSVNYMDVWLFRVIFYTIKTWNHCCLRVLCRIRKDCGCWTNTFIPF